MFARIQPYEFAAGWVPGQVDEGDGVEHEHPLLPPLEALALPLRSALQDGNCFVGFSGGRDSSVILALAIQVARREGLPMPAAVTNRYPGIPEADETHWQEMVIRHLDVEHWVIRDFTDELDLLGPSARRSLLEHGPLWPATVHNRRPIVELARGGIYIDGEGGDEIFGDFRITPIKELVTGARSVNRDALRKLTYAVAPIPIRRRLERRRREVSDREWLRPPVAKWYRESVVRDHAELPLAYPKSVLWTARRRAVRTAISNLDEVGRTLGVRYLHPFYDIGFLRALGAYGGRLGFSSRTETMKALFSDLLPEPVLSRSTKAYFNTAFIGNESREFLHSWDGTGLDDELIDIEELRLHWNSDWVHAGTFQLMHAAWLASQPTKSGL